MKRMGQREGEGDADTETDPVELSLMLWVGLRLGDAVAVLVKLGVVVGDTEGVKDGDAVVVAVTLGEAVKDGDVVGVGDTHAPVPRDRLTLLSASASMTRPWARDAVTDKVRVLPLCRTSIRRVRAVSRPDPAGMPRGLVGDPQ